MFIILAKKNYSHLNQEYFYLFSQRISYYKFIWTYFHQLYILINNKIIKILLKNLTPWGMNVLVFFIFLIY